MLLLRHGQSVWNEVRRWQGTADIELSDLGRQQAQSAAEVLVQSDITFAGVWASGLARAAETASIIASQLQISPVVEDLRLREAHAGEWEGMTPDEIEAKYPKWLEQFRRPKSFEPRDDVAARGRAALTSIVKASGSGSTCLVVAHGGLIRAVAELEADMHVPNLGGVWLSVKLTPSGTNVSVLNSPVPTAPVVARKG